MSDKKLIELPEKIDTKTLLEHLTREIAAVNERVTAKETALFELNELTAENKLFEERISDAKRLIYLLLYERQRLAEGQSAQAFADQLKAEVEAFKTKKEKAK